MRVLEQVMRIAQQQCAITFTVYFAQLGEKMAAFPACSGVKALTDHEFGYRLRMGNYRVLFDFDGGNVCVINIEELRKRDERTY